MKRSIGLWQLMGFAATSLGGVLFHFLYEWSGQSLWLAPFCGVSESTWEHMKLLFWPTFLFAVIESLFFRERKDFWCVKLKGISLGVVLIPVLFYTYNGAFGRSPDFFNIALFFICAAVAYIYETRRFNTGSSDCRTRRLAFALLCSFALLFVAFTFATPPFDIFKDPLTGGYGI